ncbi:MAG: insulinase family protein, partial [SAR324 cluster bacterium]|nr:insulinase family protein [SAR324 cluster bacterium]
MNKRSLSFLKLVVKCSFIFLCGCTQIDSHHNSIESFTSLDFSPPEVKSFFLSNGLKVYLLEDNELPLVSGALYIPGGSLWENALERGSTSAMGYMLRHGGAGARDPKTLDRDLEKLAATVSSSFGSEYGVISFSCLSADLETVSDIVADIVLKPKFDVARLDLLKLKSLEEIKRRKDDPVTVASLSFRQLLFGASPYGLPVVSEDIKRITREKLIERYKTLLSPNKAIMAVTGNVDEGRLKALLEEKLAIWNSKSVKILNPPEAPKLGNPGIFFI